MTKLFLFDIEGTTTDISFVHQVLFPYAKERIEQFLLKQQGQDEVKKACKLVEETVLKEKNIQLKNLKEISQQLEEWIDSDRKHPALKTLQGLIWDDGYKNGDFKGHVYSDVFPFFTKIKNSGHTIGIYSSGSVHAQKLIFSHSTAGDLTPFISFYFDTKVGGKRDVSSYQNILNKVSFKACDVTFFSDIPEELTAAQEAGITAIQLLRPGTQPSSFVAIKDFTEFSFS